MKGPFHLRDFSPDAQRYMEGACVGQAHYASPVMWDNTYAPISVRMQDLMSTELLERVSAETERR